MYPVIYFQGNHILSYDLMTLISVIAICFYCYHSFVTIPIKKHQIYIYILFGFFVQFFGGMILPFLYRWVYFGQRPWLDIIQKSPGRYFHSVFLSMLIYTLLASKIWKWPTRKILDRFMIATLIASAIGRIGCFLHGCCKGKPCNLPWAVHVTNNPEMGLHPTQIYMFIVETALVFYLLRLRRHQRFDGETFWRGFFLYSIYRFLIEFVRTNPPAVFGLTHAQIFSGVGVGLSACVLSYYNDKFPKTKKPPLKKNA